MRMTRRGFLGAAGLAGLAAAGFGPLLARPSQTAELVRSGARLPEPFTAPLPVPPEVTGDHVRITQRETDLEILPGLRTRVLAYDGRFPGPTVVSRSGRPMVVTHDNQLPVPTVVHLHGGHTPPEHDGFPTEAAHGPRDHVYPGTQRAATLWYHDHRMDFTGPQVYRGLLGMHLVRDDEEDALPLPRGEREVPLVITDRAFAEDGSFAYPSLDPALRRPGVVEDFMEGVLGDVVLVNGAPWPVLEVAAVRYRFRILNASNARRYLLALRPGAPLVQIGSDGGLLETPVTHAELPVAPGERFDVVVDFAAFAPGAEVTLRNLLGDRTTSDVMRFRVTRRAADDSAVPRVLSRIERLDPARAARTREWRFSLEHHGDHRMWMVNGDRFDPDGSDADPVLGQTEVWRLVSDAHHPVHVHLSPFQVLTRRGDPPSPADAGWKDTVDLRPHEYLDLAVRFTGYAGRYVVHCHNLEHEDMAMMATFVTR
ncbi:multicopper oxidase family protein [Amycolatopsis thermoflava]|uniref:multicopper oxidase family protein n=1 Tax=Amycolatopsis thermoflava TaxID=84480 RepID=UPI0037F78C6F